jgi:hypothetical protein
MIDPTSCRPSELSGQPARRVTGAYEYQVRTQARKACLTLTTLDPY